MAFMSAKSSYSYSMSKRQLGLGLIALAALSGLAGFLIVYHYATLERPMVEFSMVIDAGSTQTRSNLFIIKVDSPALGEWIDDGEETAHTRGHRLHYPLSKLFEVKQVGTCVNGEPLTSVKSLDGARKLVETCVNKFSRQIKHLDVKLDSDSERFRELQEALKNFRVNSATHVHMGATAGMRALKLTNSTVADEKVAWVSRAISEASNTLNGPYLNKGFVGIISGLDEAAYDWISANFACDQLEVFRPSDIEIYAGQSNQLISYETETRHEEHQQRNKRSIGILEMGGASMQMSFERGNESRLFNGMKERDVELFNQRYKLQLRSDLCMGTSQAILRSNYVLLRDLYTDTVKLNATAGSQIQVTNPCLQNMARLELSGTGLREFLRSPCINQTADNEFSSFLSARTMVVIEGTGAVMECDRLLAKLIETQLCVQYFSICPRSKGSPPPGGVPFVTVSGYNKAVEVLNLDKAPMRLGQQGQLELKIESNLGGFSIVHSEFLRAIGEFCTMDISKLAQAYPKLNSNFYAVNCLQLVYINKILTEFYGFDPQSSWQSIKFLVFPVTSASLVSGKVLNNNSSRLDYSNDIGWTLGLLLNETSHQYGGKLNNEHTVFYHHGASVAFVLRATLILMVAFVMIAISLLMLAVLSARRAHRKAHISHPEHVYYEPEA